MYERVRQLCRGGGLIVPDKLTRHLLLAVLRDADAGDLESDTEDSLLALELALTAGDAALAELAVEETLACHLTQLQTEGPRPKRN